MKAQFRKTFALMCILLLAGFASAQTSTSSIYGEVTDAQNAAVVGAKVTLTQVATNAVRTTESDATGRYQFMGVPPGKYTLKVEQNGFRTTLNENVELTVNTTTKLSVTLEVGSISESVTVTESAAGLNTTDASVGNVITIKQVGVLPLEGRNPAALLTLQAGVTFSGDPTDQRSGATVGGRSDQANVTLDGADINDQQTQNLFAPALPIPIDSIQEFRFTTSNPGAEQGRSSGGQVALITKGGSNDFHGSVYWFHRNTATTANDFFNKRSGLDTPKLLRNQFGGSLGGAIWRDRLFFFGNYEGTRRREETNVLTIVPTANMRDGVLGYQCADTNMNMMTSDECPGITVAGLTGSHTFGPGFNGLTPAQLASIDPGSGSPGITPGVNAAMIALLQTYPVGNDCSQGLDAGINFCGFRFNSPVAADQNIYVTRFDYNVTQDARHMVSWRGTLNDVVADTTPPQFPGQPVSQQTVDNSKGFASSYTAAISNTMTNVFRYNLTRQGLEFSGQTNPGFAIRSYTAPFSAARAAIRAVPNHHFVEDFTWAKGSHTLQMGGTARLITNQRASLANSFPAYAINDGFCLNFCSDVDNPATGTLVGAGLPAVGNRNPFRRGLLALYGTITQVGSAFFFDGTNNVLAAGQAAPREFKYNEWEFYFQDTWRWTKNLTVTYGVRYALYGVPYETNGLQVGPTVNIGDFLNQRIAAMNAGLPSATVAPLQWDLIGEANGRRGYYDPDHNNFAPSLSFAYSPNLSGDGIFAKLLGGPNKSVIRGGFRVVFDRIGGAMVVSQDLNGAVGLVTPVISPTSTMGFGGPVCTTPPSGPCQAPRFIGLNNLPTVADFVAAPSAGFPTTPAVSAFLGGSQGFVIDDNLRTPYAYSMQLTYGRQLPGAMELELSYIGRLGQKLLSKADIGAPLIYHRDPASGQTFAEAINALWISSQRGALDPSVPAELNQIGPIPYFENLFTGIAGFCSAVANCTSTQTVYEFFTGPFPSFTDVLANLEGFSDLASPTWFQQQFNSLPAWTNLARSNYHSLQTVLRKRFTHGLTFDINYTYGRSLDYASSIENVGALGGQIADIFNPKNQYALSGFDLKHQLTSNWVYELPFGRGKQLGSGANSVVNQIIGGWQTSGILRWRGAFPLSPANGFNFPTNFFLTTPGTWTCDPNTRIGKGPDGPNLFGNDFGASLSLQCLDFTLSGGSGSRNAIRGARFSNLDFALRKSFTLPFEGHRFIFEWQAFNLLNHANFDDRTLNLNPESPTTFGRYTGTIGQDLRGNNARVMQFTLRYDF